MSQTKLLNDLYELYVKSQVLPAKGCLLSNVTVESKISAGVTNIV